MKRMKIPSKAQEEAVGFVAIIVIVALALVFFIGITLRNAEPQALSSNSVSQFLDSSAVFTTTCDLGLRTRYATLQQLIENCYKNPQTRCINGESACEIYNQTMQRLLEKGWPTSDGKVVTGYVYNISYESASRSESIISFRNGSCEGDFISEERLSPDSISSGTYVASLKICF